MTETRNVFAIILAVMILQIAGGLLSMLTPLGLEALGTAPQFIGGIAALYATGFMLGACRFGLVRQYPPVRSGGGRDFSRVDCLVALV